MSTEVRFIEPFEPMTDLGISSLKRQSLWLTSLYLLTMKSGSLKRSSPWLTSRQLPLYLMYIHVDWGQVHWSIGARDWSWGYSSLKQQSPWLTSLYLLTMKSGCVWARDWLRDNWLPLHLAHIHVDRGQVFTWLTSRISFPWLTMWTMKSEAFKPVTDFEAIECLHMYVIFLRSGSLKRLNPWLTLRASAHY